MFFLLSSPPSPPNPCTVSLCKPPRSSPYAQKPLTFSPTMTTCPSPPSPHLPLQQPPYLTCSPPHSLHVWEGRSREHEDLYPLSTSSSPSFPLPSPLPKQSNKLYPSMPDPMRAPPPLSCHYTQISISIPLLFLYLYLIIFLAFLIFL